MSSPSAFAVFEYEPLTEEGAIRLILLQPSQNFSAPIQCSIKHSTLSHYEHELVDHYVALSYVWGDPNDTQTVFVDGKPVNVTVNLASALYHLRQQEAGRALYLWADALCINQADISEKSKQVQQMGAIYHTAHHTVIYLGQSTKDTDIAFDNLRLIQQGNAVAGRQNNYGTLNPEALQNIYNILRSNVLSRPWFKRVWVFQELVLSHDPWLQCGNKRMRWDTFCDIFSAIEKEFADLASQDLDTSTVAWNSEVNGSRTLLEMQARRRNFHYNTTVHDEDSHHNSLIDLLSLRRGIGASDIRDFIFAHQGLAEDYRMDPKALNVDYTMSSAQVYAEAARYMINQGNLDKVLEQAFNVNTVNRLPNLPSWVPDWSLQFVIGLPSSWSHTSATKYLKAAIDFTRWTHSSMRLICQGRCIGNIEVLSETLSNNEIYPHEIQQASNQVLEDTNSAFANSEKLRAKACQEVFISLYNEMLKLFGSDLQHLKARPGLNLSRFFGYYSAMGLQFLEDKEIFENYPINPMEFIILFILGRFNYDAQDGLQTEIEQAMKDALFLQGRRVGFIHFSPPKYEEMKWCCPLGLEIYSVRPFAVPFGLFPDSAETGDKLCLIDGLPKLYVCRPLRKSRNNDLTQHMIIIGECSVNTLGIDILRDIDISDETLRDFMRVKFVFY